ncbi:reverse transcriptase domain-containing protein [Tanacetum coccineum]
MADITTEENASVALIVSSPIHRKCLCSGCANGEPDTLKGNANLFEVLNTLDVEEDSGNMKSNRLGGPCTSVFREMSSRRSGVTTRIPEKLVRKRSSRKKNFSANHKGRRKSINGEKSEQTEQVRLGTIVGMVRGHTSRKRPREKSEPLLDNEISFSSTPGHRLVDSPIILEALIKGFLVRRIYVDGGSSSEVMYEHCFQNLRAETRAKLNESRKPLLGFSGKISYPIGTIKLNVTMGESERLRTIPMEFTVVKSHSPYNVILGRTGLRSLGAVASTIYSMIKFPIANGIATMTTKKKPSKNVGGWKKHKDRPGKGGPPSKHQISKEQSAGANKKVKGRQTKKEILRIPHNHHPAHLRKTLKQMKKLRERMNTLKDNSKAGLQRRWLFMTTIRMKPLPSEETCRLRIDLDLSKYYGSMPMHSLGLRQTWPEFPALFGVQVQVLPRRLQGIPPNRKWRMCINFKDLNKACPKDLYPLPEINWKIESLMVFKYKYFLDAYKGYHQIQITKKDEEKTTFHIDEEVFCYTKMPFRLKNAGATYQILVDTIFKGKMGRNLEAYVDDMVIKSKTELEMIKDVEETFLTLKKINMKLNPKKCSFGMEEGKFLGYIVTFKGTRANPEKEKAIVNMPSPTNLHSKKVHKQKGISLDNRGRRSISGDEEIDSRTTNLNDFKEGRRIHGLSISDQQSSQRHFVCGKTRENKSQSITRLRRYFQGHSIKVITDKPISLILNNREATGRLAKWGIELETYGIKYALRSAIKGQVLADFLEDTMAKDRPTQIKTSGPDKGKSEEEQEAPEAKTPKNLGTEADIWKIYNNGASNEYGSGACLILIDPEGAEYSYALRLNFSNSSNDAEYEALLAGLRIVAKMKVKKMHAFVDSNLVASQVEGSYKAKGENTKKINKKSDDKELNERSVDTREVNAIVEEATRTWMTPIQEYIEHEILPEDVTEA